MSKSIILLSGGLDSLVSLGILKEKYNITLALTFNYGQKSLLQEINATKNICKFYKLEHKIVKLDWLKNITHNALVEDYEIPKGIQKNSKALWIPNRNSLFLNIAACYADSENYDYIVIGVNKEEARNFPDNSEEFINKINSSFEYSTSCKVKVVAPLIKYNKNDIVKQAIKNDIPLKFVYSCYGNHKKNCGKCDSCIRLKNALKTNSANEYLKVLFE